MKFRKLIIVCCLLLCTGCGKQIEQEQIEIPETSQTAETETTAMTEEETAGTETVRTTTGKAETTTGTSAGTTTTAETTQTTTVTQTETKKQTSGTVVTEKKQEETAVADNHQSNGGNAESRQTTVTRQTTAAAATAAPQTTTTVTTTAAPAIQTEETTTLKETETETEPAFIHLTGNAQEILSQMTLEQKIYQMFIVTPEALTGVGTATAAGSRTQESVYAQPVGGIVYFADNLVSGNQTASMLSNTQAYARDTGIGMFFAVDEEGGLVARCAKKLGTTKLSPMQEYGNRNDREEAVRIGETLGNDIQQFGFNVDFAPVADVNLNSGNELGNRIFSSDPEVVGNMVSGVVSGLQSTGVSATLKHFPGLGAEDGNAHYDEKIIIDRSLEELRAAEFVPFQSGIAAGADFVMVSHQIVTGAGDGMPSCLSYTVCTDWLKGELGFSGLIVTDSFRMNTISGSYSSGEAAVLAVQAGVDIILMPVDLTESVQAVENAVNNGLISEARIDDSVLRILEKKEQMNLLG